MSLVATTSTPEFPWESPVPAGDFWQGIEINNLARAFYQNFTTGELSSMKLDPTLPHNDKLKSLDPIVAARVVTEKEALGSTPTTSPEAKQYRNFLYLHATVKELYGDYLGAEVLFREFLEWSEPENLADYGALAHNLMNQGRLGEAEGYARISLNQICEHAGLGTDSPQALGSLRMLMEIYAKGSRFDEAWKLHGEGVELVDGMTRGRFGKYKGEEQEALDELKDTIAKLERESDSKSKL